MGPRTRVASRRPASATLRNGCARSQAVDRDLGADHNYLFSLFDNEEIDLHMSIGELDRRRFIRLCAAGSVGLALTRPRRAEALGPLVQLFLQFVGEVAAAVIASSIIEYLHAQRASGDHGAHIRRTNERLALRGFTECRGPVYSSLASEPRIFYPVVNSHCSCLNFTAPFFRNSCDCDPVAMVQGPHMAGLVFAARLLRRRMPAEEAAGYLVPVEGRRISHGTPQTGYDGPLIYDSQEARVRVDYEPVTLRSGKVVVKARRHSDHRFVVDDLWGIAFP